MSSRWKIFVGLGIFLVSLPLASAKAYSGPYPEAVQFVKKQQLITINKTTASPYKNISREDFFAAAMKAAGFKGIGKKCFNDVQTGQKAALICEAKLKGFLTGYKGRYFYPHRSISFKEAAAALTAIFKLHIDNTVEGDANKKSILALESVRAIPLSVVRFTQSITRAQTAEMLLRLATKTVTKKTMTYAGIQRYEGAVVAIKKKYNQEDFDYIGEVTSQAYLEEGSVAPSIGDVIPAGMGEQLFLEIKTIATIINVARGTGDNQLILNTYKGKLFLNIPAEQRYKIYPPVDAGTAELMDHNYRGWSLNKISGDTVFLVDQFYVYKIIEDYELNIIGIIDAPTFKAKTFAAGEPPVFVDRNHVYFLNAHHLYTVPDANSATFDYKFGNFYSDSTHVFYTHKGEFKEIVGADAATLIQDGKFAKDKNHTWTYDPVAGMLTILP